MKNIIKILALSVSCVLWTSCSPVKYTSLDAASNSADVLPSGLSSEEPAPSFPAPAPEPAPEVGLGPVAALPPDLGTGVSTIDNDSQPLLDSIAKADPEFDASSVYYIRFAILGDLLNKLVQKKYTAEPEACTLEAKWKVLFFSNSKTRPLELSSCEGFQRARQVAAANGGSCTPQVGTSKQFKIGNIIQFDRTTELGADCNCFRRYDVGIFNGALLSHEVRAFASTEACAAEFAEYR